MPGLRLDPTANLRIRQTHQPPKSPIAMPKRTLHSSSLTIDEQNKKQALLVFAILVSLWGTIVIFINPVGEFMINDDWCFTRIIETVLEGKQITNTGWGDGGPSVLCHMLWGVLFSKLFGFSVTILRISVLVLGVGSSFTLLWLLRKMRTSWWLAFLATLTLVFNPLFLSLSFSYMSDITFLFLFIVSFFFLQQGVEDNHDFLLITGLFFALLSMLTRQIGLVIPVGFLITCFLHPQGQLLNRKKMFLFTFCIAIIPWILYEIFLWQSGSTPVTSHPVFRKIFSAPINKGFPDYLFFLFSQAGVMLLYTGFLLSPLLVIRCHQLLRWKPAQKIAIFLVSAFLLFEVSLISGIINPPIRFYKNTIYNFGIGPLLLKDIYLLGVQRTVSLPKPVFFLLAFLALLFAAALVFFASRSIKQLLATRKDKQNAPDFTSACALICAFVYLGVILLTGFHDRYLIPVSTLLIVWFTKQITITNTNPTLRQTIFSATLLLFLAGTSVFGLKDFMSAKRSLFQAQSYILHDMKINPCEIDGGFEFNGYFCSDINTVNYENKKYSWWWVNKEKYLITLGPLSNYQIVKKFPFSRYIGNDGSICILQPD